MNLNVRRAAAGGAFAAAAVVAALVWWPAPEAESRPGAGAAPLPAAPRWSLLSAGDGTPVAQPQASVAAAVERRLYGAGSLRGTEPDGDWSVDAHGRLEPSISLRRRFDHYLAALGEASVAELTALMQAHAERDVGAAAAQEIRTLWDRYLAVHQHRYRTQVRLDDPQGWEAALAERQAVRRAHLGRVWADAFYSQEEQALQAHIEAARQQGVGERAGAAGSEHALLGPPAPGADPTALHEQRVRQFGAEAAERLRQEDIAWADWQRRLEHARGRIAALRRAPELSEVQREAAVAQVIDETFGADERLRARSLLLP